MELLIYFLTGVFSYLIIDVVLYFKKRAVRKKKHEKNGGFIEWF